ncbi:MAG: hypothetical protein U0354_15760 [Candidatus Sericytochromatia bacterium]
MSENNLLKKRTTPHRYNLPTLDDINNDRLILSNLLSNIPKIDPFFIKKLTKIMKFNHLKTFKIFYKNYVKYLQNKKLKIEKLMKYFIKGFSGSIDEPNNIFIVLLKYIILFLGSINKFILCNIKIFICKEKMYVQNKS